MICVLSRIIWSAQQKPTDPQNKCKINALGIVSTVGTHAHIHTDTHTVLTHTRQFVSGGPCSRGQGCHCSADGRARVASGIPSGVLSEKMACSELRDYEETMRFNFCFDGTYIGRVENCVSVTVSQDEGRAGGLLTGPYRG